MTTYLTPPPHVVAAVDNLNRLFAADPAAVEAVLAKGSPVNAAIRAEPYALTSSRGEAHWVDAKDVLNAALGLIPSGPSKGKGWVCVKRLGKVAVGLMVRKALAPSRPLPPDSFFDALVDALDGGADVAVPFAMAPAPGFVTYRIERVGNTDGCVIEHSDTEGPTTLHNGACTGNCTTTLRDDTREG
jgi:hypothetical protein